MTGKQWLIVGGMAAGVFWLLTRSAAAQSGGWQIEGTDGKRYRLNERGGRIYDQNGGLWT